MALHAGMLGDTKLKFYMQTQNMHGTSKSSERYLLQERSKRTRVICTVSSPGLADTSNCTGEEAECFDKTCSVTKPVSTMNQNASDMRFIGQGRIKKSRAGAACRALIGEWENIKGLSQEEMWGFFFFYSMPPATLPSMHPEIPGNRTAGSMTELKAQTLFVYY